MGGGGGGGPTSLPRVVVGTYLCRMFVEGGGASWPTSLPRVVVGTFLQTLKGGVGNINGQ